MQWTYQGKTIDKLPQEVEGFVYLITNLTNNKKYVGKKLAKFKTTKPPLKGKKKQKAWIQRKRLERLLGFLRSFTSRCKKIRCTTIHKRNFTYVSKQRRNELFRGQGTIRP